MYNLFYKGGIRVKNLSTWLLVIFIIMFAAFRIAVIIETQQGQSVEGIISANIEIEIVLMFITLISTILIIKRNLIGAIRATINRNRNIFAINSVN